MIYSLTKKLIERKEFERDNMIKKLNVFFIFGQLTENEYEELLNLINNPKEKENISLIDIEQQVINIIYCYTIIININIYKNIIYNFKFLYICT